MTSQVSVHLPGQRQSARTPVRAAKPQHCALSVREGQAGRGSPAGDRSRPGGIRDVQKLDTGPHVRGAQSH